MKVMPIQGTWDRKRHAAVPPSSIPWEIIESHEKQAQANHYQDLATLARRGGLSHCEAIAILEDRPWTETELDESIEKLKKLVSQGAAL